MAQLNWNNLCSDLFSALKQIALWSNEINSSQNTTKGILAKMGVALSELHVSAFYSGHHQVTITDYKRYTNMLNVGW